MWVIAPFLPDLADYNVLLGSFYNSVCTYRCYTSEKQSCACWPSRRWPVKPASLPTHRFRSIGPNKAFPTLFISPAYIKEKNILIISGGDPGASTQSPGVGKSETSVGHAHPRHTVLALQVAKERLSVLLLCHIHRGRRNFEAEPSSLSCKLH